MEVNLTSINLTEWNLEVNLTSINLTEWNLEVNLTSISLTEWNLEVNLTSINLHECRTDMTRELISDVTLRESVEMLTEDFLAAVTDPAPHRRLRAGFETGSSSIFVSVKSIQNQLF